MEVEGAENARLLWSNRQRVLIEVCFCSLLGECWIARNSALIGKTMIEGPANAINTPISHCRVILVPPFDPT